MFDIGKQSEGINEAFCHQKRNDAINNIKFGEVKDNKQLFLFTHLALNTGARLHTIVNIKKIHKIEL